MYQTMFLKNLCFNLTCLTSNIYEWIQKISIYNVTLNIAYHNVLVITKKQTNL